MKCLNIKNWKLKCLNNENRKLKWLNIKNWNLKCVHNENWKLKSLNNENWKLKCLYTNNWNMKSLYEMSRILNYIHPWQKSFSVNLAFSKKLSSRVVSSSNNLWTQSFSSLDFHSFLSPPPPPPPLPHTMSTFQD